ncbi:endo-1,3(4)-beta-glucanase, putative [Talaromyces stipitatus ATCC 10500]|uniref:endo-1,3(4)-beta-glucanase n=1 Tax=Talaromyces stipitatus (strain ATCC 10500 / CBS 375.48 / QM 6759 / NRRL 1006) TaxID=441959 RepID=B8MH60_TALSN|nr:endo-1,3(4)-beta-glucanase, putative [Talaromyces stipitatus ATCC 10500]EED16874.1 endo-1,3(4)-beta-glucanase, putative [Talaromyces stipitatus ATCC 10500]
MRASTLLELAALAGLSSAQTYSLVDNYPTGMDFFSKFSFFTDSDPTHGFVDYVSETTAKSAGLIYASGNGTYIGVDNTNVASSSGRQSVRLTSNAAYTKGLFVLDLAHMPGSVCGSWPAFWTVGSDWPNNGEIDIIEGVSQQSANAMTLHTSNGCSINDSGFTGHLATSNCYVNAAGQANNAGCSIDATTSATYGDAFNTNGGGIYAMEWTDNYIQVFEFSHATAPADINSNSPDPSNWGEPAARFQGNCDIDSHFSQHQIVFDITFCGDWAGNVWSSSTCSSYASTCNSYVQNNPSAFTESYWLINSLKVYQS